MSVIHPPETRPDQTRLDQTPQAYLNRYVDHEQHDNEPLCHGIGEEPRVFPKVKREDLEASCRLARVSEFDFRCGNDGASQNSQAGESQTHDERPYLIRSVTMSNASTQRRTHRQYP